MNKAKEAKKILKKLDKEWSIPRRATI